MGSLISRIAPTPSGYLHIGNALSFILTWLMVRKEGGTLHLRIDDLDSARKRDEYVEEIFRTLEWLGMDYDLGPGGPDDLLHTYSQTHRIDQYQALLKQLREQELLFACSCSRREISAASPDGHYPGTCHNLHHDFSSPNIAWRIHIQRGTQVAWADRLLGTQEIDLYHSMRDFVVRRKDGNPAYQIASLADDRDMGVNLIVRGQDLLPSTAAQLFLARSLEISAFDQIQWVHHPLLMREDGVKLSKSHKAPTLKSLRENGGSPHAVFQLAARWLGIPSTEIFGLRDLLDRYMELPSSFTDIPDHIDLF